MRRVAAALLVLSLVACIVGAAEAPTVAWPVDDESYLTLGRSLLAQARHVEAELPLRLALMRRPGDAVLLHDLGRALLGQGRALESEKAALASLDANRRQKDAWLLLARARMAGGRRGAAIDALEAAGLLGLDLGAEAAWTLGDLYLAEKMTRRAGEVYVRALEKWQAPGESVRNVCATFLAAGDTARARFFAEELLKRDPEDGEALRVLGELALAADELETAGGYLMRALKADPRAGAVVVALGNVAARQGRESEALAFYRSARPLPGWKEAALRAEAKLLIDALRWDEALAVVRVLRDEFPRATWDVLARDIERRLADK